MNPNGIPPQSPRLSRNRGTTLGRASHAEQPRRGCAYAPFPSHIIMPTDNPCEGRFQNPVRADATPLGLSP